MDLEFIYGVMEGILLVIGIVVYSMDKEFL
jgi:hypothetical protein